MCLLYDVVDTDERWSSTLMTWPGVKGVTICFWLANKLPNARSPLFRSRGPRIVVCLLLLLHCCLHSRFGHFPCTWMQVGFYPVRLVSDWPIWSTSVRADPICIHLCLLRFRFNYLMCVSVCVVVGVIMLRGVWLMYNCFRVCNLMSVDHLIDFVYHEYRLHMYECIARLAH